MPRFLQIASYTPDGLRELLKQGGTEGVFNALAEMAKHFDTKPDDAMFAFGEDDLYVVWELPDNESAASVSLAMVASGV